MERRFEHFCRGRVNPRLFCRMGGALYSPGSEGKSGSQDTSGFIYGKPSPLHRIIKKKFGGGLPSFPMTSSSLGTQFVKLSFFHRPLCSAEAGLCCRADPRLGEAGGAWRGLVDTTPVLFPPSALHPSLHSSHQTPLLAGAALSVLPSPMPLLLPVPQSSRLTPDSFNIYCREQVASWEGAVGRASGCSRGQLRVEGNGLDTWQAVF